MGKIFNTTGLCRLFYREVRYHAVAGIPSELIYDYTSGYPFLVSRISYRFWKKLDDVFSCFI